MRPAYWLFVYIFALTLLLVTALKSARASGDRNSVSPVSINSTDFSHPEADFGPSFGSKRLRLVPFNFAEYSPVYSDEIESLLYTAVRSRIGLPYRPGGTDDRGYDCSGFVWRVFQDAGIDFERGSARKLWQTLPKATEEEESLFGTLVFFKGLNHVGIVRDADSFYHASSSQGIVRSHFDEYWGDRVIGYRRVFAPVKKKLRMRRR
jgi:hypothetical protein